MRARRGARLREFRERAGELAERLASVLLEKMTLLPRAKEQAQSQSGAYSCKESRWGSQPYRIAILKGKSQATMEPSTHGLLAETDGTQPPAPKSESMPVPATSADTDGARRSGDAGKIRLPGGQLVSRPVTQPNTDLYERLRRLHRELCQIALKREEEDER